MRAGRWAPPLSKRVRDPASALPPARMIHMSGRYRVSGLACAAGAASGDRSGRRKMPPSNRLFDDLARLMTDAAGAAQGVRREAETVVRAQAERLIRDLDVASREELDVLRDLVTSLRTQNEALAARVAALEAKAGASTGAAGLSEGV